MADAGVSGSPMRAVVEVATREHHVESTFTGSFGRMRAEDATALAIAFARERLLKAAAGA